MIEISHIHKVFNGVTVLNDVSAVFESGKTNLIIGISGSGKTVLMKCIVGLLQPDSGQVLFNKESFHEMPPERRKEVRRQIGMLFQGAALFDSLTVEENVMLPLNMFSHSSKKEKLERVNFCLERVNLAGANHKFPGEISGGMKKRVALARTLILQPKIILYDEPTGGLDPITGREISHLINEVQSRYKTAALIITHDLVCAKITTNRIVILSEGKNYKEGNYEELDQSKDSIVEEFFRK